MRLTIDTDVDAFETAVAAVYAAYGFVVPEGDVVEVVEDEDNGGAPGEDDYLPARWTRRRLRRLVEWLGDSDAAVALRYIAEHAPAVPLDEVFAHMAEHTGIADFDGKAMGGRMSAIGFARNNIGGGVGPVYDTDYGARKYRIDERLAAAVLEEMDAFQGE